MPVIDSIAEQLNPTRPPTFTEDLCQICNAAMQLIADKPGPACTQCGMTAEEAATLNQADKVRHEQTEAKGTNCHFVNETHESDDNTIWIDLPKMNTVGGPPPPKPAAKKDSGMPFKKKNGPKIIREKTGKVPQL